MKPGALGEVYADGEVLFRQGETGDCMYVIQEGTVEIFMEKGDREITLRQAREGEILGEMAIVDRVVRSASVRAVGETRVLTLDKKNFLRRVHQDPSLALNVVEIMSKRIRELSEEIARMKHLDS